MAKNGNRALGEVKKQKKDEFYTQLADINAELRHYSVPDNLQMLCRTCNLRKSNL